MIYNTKKESVHFTYRYCTQENIYSFRDVLQVHSTCQLCWSVPPSKFKVNSLLLKESFLFKKNSVAHSISLLHIPTGQACFFWWVMMIEDWEQGLDVYSHGESSYCTDASCYAVLSRNADAELYCHEDFLLLCGSLHLTAKAWTRSARKNCAKQGTNPSLMKQAFQSFQYSFTTFNVFKSKF